MATAILLAACNPPPVARPREGAQPVAGGTAIRLEAIPPPTLSIAGGLIPTATPTDTPEPTPPPSPGVVIAGASPFGSPGLSPIITGLQPAPGSALPAGDVVISARISGTSDLVDVAAFVDGEEIPLDLSNGTVRTKTVSFVRTFVSGTHEVRVQARDEHGQLGGYRWQFSVGGGRQPVVSAPPPQATPAPAAPTGTRLPAR
jgi:hypothetical protein